VPFGSNASLSFSARFDLYYQIDHFLFGVDHLWTQVHTLASLSLMIKCLLPLNILHES
jgi:hypothetical protein